MLPGTEGPVSATGLPLAELSPRAPRDGWTSLSTACAGPVGPGGGVLDGVAFTPDGRHLVTANYNGTIYVLRLALPRN